MSLAQKFEVNTPYLHAVQNKDFAKILTLYEKGHADLNAITNDGTSAIWMAAARGHTDIVKLLARLGANVNQCNKLGYSPMMMAVHNNHIRTVRRLFEDGGHVNKRNMDGSTCVVVAASRGHAEMILLLKKIGGDLDRPNTEGVCPMLAAIKSRQKQAVHMLYRMGTDIGHVSAKGYLVFENEYATHGSVTDGVFLSDVLREVTRKCSVCKMTSPKRLGSCRRCERVHYCSKICQKKAHNAHKKVCIKNHHFYL
mmetsp:Transcript_16851/g.28150  ORF Transcript_16851/g.28150 Transcript_16851/m.28150 type:complete len:254 (+) Transcript_16851:80-841(+)